MEVRDTIFVKDTVWYEKDTVTFAPDSVVVIDSVWCKGDTVFIQRLSNQPGTRTSVSTDLKDNRITTTCKTDSLTKVIDGLRRELREVYRKRSEVKTVEVIEEVERKVIPKWIWYLIIFNVVQLVWRTRRLWSKI